MLTTIETFRVLDTEVEARVDTGAKLCALHVDLACARLGRARFFLYETPYDLPIYRRTRINGEERPVVLLNWIWGPGEHLSVETTLVDRSERRYSALVGRNLIRRIGLPVHINADDN